MSTFLIDTHCHLDAAEFNADREHEIHAAINAGVAAMVVPAVERANFDTVIALQQQYGMCAYALGIHPLYVTRAQEADLAVLHRYLQRTNPVAVGEIGLDFFVADSSAELQTFYFIEQLKLAKEFDLPVILHVRKSVDAVLKQLRRFKVRGGIAHAFNGSLQQAEQLIALGFKLGFGGAMTWQRATHIRNLAVQLPLESIVLETDAPDIPPQWRGNQGRNAPQELCKIAEVLATLRGENIGKIVDTTSQNALAALPKLAMLYTSPKVLL